jgi:hypothetical protein
MKLSKRPPGVFYAGHSGKRFGTSDLPTLRALRDFYRKTIDVLRQMQTEEKDPAMLVAGATILASLQTSYDFVGQALDLIERTPPAWRPL